MNKKKIGIHGVPRSGTTWLGEIINSSANVRYKYQPLFSYELKNFLNDNSDLTEINKFFEKLNKISSPFLDQEEAKKKGIIPVFNKNKITHIVYKEVRYHHIVKNLLLKDSEIKIIGIIRNPLAAIYSWLKSPREFRKDLGWSEIEEWRYANKKNSNKPEEFYGFEKWKEVANLFLELENQFPDRFLLINYKDLLKDTYNQVNRLFSFCELDIEQQTTAFLSNSKSIDKNTTYSVYRNKQHDDEWKNKLNYQIIDEIQQELKNTQLEKYLMI
ncbi:Sulfotransferase domain-containing protein [Psychroflexus salarius]|uniref:Sulfotransferase domain-containing protein n=1 Tax=Psychroflexus salarius TaxID=1155689 RepID=A0A1M4YCG7_9FLAO|nr:sulfotransferase domain-containing protein [Psychroflexus salarius]SHF03263.1 Sulfotransferase domain-containing protein [Psychroflexus salarius]